jgi:hypothetical protein
MPNRVRAPGDDLSGDGGCRARADAVIVQLRFHTAH